MTENINVKNENTLDKLDKTSQLKEWGLKMEMNFLNIKPKTNNKG